MTHCGTHAANLPLASLVQDEAQPGCAFGSRLALDEADLGRGRLAVFQLYPPTQCSQGLSPRLASDEDFVFTLVSVAGMGESLREGAIVGQKQQPFAFQIQSTHGIDPLRHGKQVHYRGSPVGVMGGGEVARRLVQDKVDWRGGGCQGLAVHDNVVVQWIYPGAQLGDDLAVDPHPSLADQFFTGAPGTDATARHCFLQSFGFHESR
jgi:hypothetical protein